MGELPDESVQCVVTSPPYFGLRKYSGEQDLIWGGDPSCGHQWVDAIKTDDSGDGHYTGRVRWQHVAQEAQDKGIHVRDVVEGAWAKGGFKTGFCSLCGAWKGAYGLEPTPEMYVQHTIEILREIRRVLRPDGVVFWDIGDSYAGSGSPGGDFRDGKGGDEYLRPYNRKGGVLKPKDLCLIPFRVALEAQRDGWWVRSVIIWSKPNPMPESAQDRPTESHEYILMLTKSGTTQYWTHRDGGGTREKPKADYRWVNQITQEEVAIEPGDWKKKIKCPECNGTGYVDLDALWSISDKCPTCNGKKETQLWKRINLWKGHDYYWDPEAVREAYSPTERWGGDTYRGAVKKGSEGEDAGLDRERSCFPGSGRNIRSVWEFPTQPYPEAHFAVFPEKLPEICIKAATPEVGCCSKCGAPGARVVERPDMRQRPLRTLAKQDGQRIHSGFDGYPQSAGQEWQKWRDEHPDKTIGWRPTCKCNAPRVPSLVLDPMMGAGTTLWVAKKLNRYAVGYEISEEYCQLAVERCRQQVLL